MVLLRCLERPAAWVSWLCLKSFVQSVGGACPVFATELLWRIGDAIATLAKRRLMMTRT